MRNWGKTPYILVALNSVCLSTTYADDATPVTPSVSALTASTTAEVSSANPPSVSASASSTTTEVSSATTTEPATTSTGMNPTTPTSVAPTADTARDALKAKSSDVTTEKNLDQVFKASEKSYSLVKKGKYSMSYDLGYSFYRGSRLDIALASDSSSITRLRIEEEWLDSCQC